MRFEISISNLLNRFISIKEIPHYLFSHLESSSSPSTSTKEFTILSPAF